MKLLQANSGKIGFVQLGPIYYLHEDIRLGEVAVCIARSEDLKEPKPCLWLLGPIEQVIDYVDTGKDKTIIDPSDAAVLISKLEEAKKKMANTPLQRLANVLKVDISELIDDLTLAQVEITNPIAGIKNYKDCIVAWSTGNNILNNK